MHCSTLLNQNKLTGASVPGSPSASFLSLGDRVATAAELFPRDLGSHAVGGPTTHIKYDLGPVPALPVMSL